MRGARSGRRRVAAVAGVAAAVGMLMSSRSALADCMPVPPFSGATVVCSGAVNAPFTASGLGSLTVDIQPGTSFNAPLSLSMIGLLSVVNGGNLQSVTFDTIGALSFENLGNVNNGLNILGPGTHTVTNRGAIDQNVTLTGDGNTTIVNEGFINPGIQKTGGGSLTILNMPGGIINQFVTVDGTAQTSIDNSGTIQNAITLGSGDDSIVNRATGTINGIVDQGAGMDLFQMLGGLVNGEVRQGDGNDAAVISGGEITQFVRAQAGDDQLLWNGGLVGGIDMGTGTDHATLQNLTQAALRSIPIGGGLGGGDTLTWDNVQGTIPGRLIQWELVELTNGSALTMDNTNLTLGDAGTGTGTLTIDPASTLLAGQGQHAIVPASAGQFVNVLNAGTIDLTNGPESATDSLIVGGNYIGQGGQLIENTVLAGDGAPSDRLVIDRGTATGTTSLIARNAGGLGDLTVANGILVVDAINGATTAPGAFALGAPAVAGPYEYMLVRGSVDASNPQAWYLRSGFDCSDPSAPSPPCPGTTPAGPEDPADPEVPLIPLTPPLPPSVPGVSFTPLIPPVPQIPIVPVTSLRPSGPPAPAPAAVVPSYRQEVSLYAALPALSLLYGRALLDTLHQRVGEQEHLRCRTGPCSRSVLNGAWGRVIAQTGERDGHPFGIYGDGPEYDFDFLALQAGLDVYRARLANGLRHHAGVYGALGDGRSGVTHFNGLAAGRNTFTAYSGGGYWTLFGPAGWYLDSVIQGTWYDMKGQSPRLPALKTDGLGYAASLEGGLPFRSSAGLVVEPQAQLVYQAVDLDTARDIGATVRFEDVDSLAGRIGVRLAGTWALPAGTWDLPQPGLLTAWVRPSLWQDFLGDPRTLFSSETGFIPFRANLGEAWAELNGGLTVQIDRTTSLFANASYQAGLEGESEAWDGKLGLRVNW